MAFIAKNIRVSNLTVGPLPGGGNGGGGGYSLPIESSGLQLFWDMGESTSYSGTGTTINDLSGNGNNGVLTGTPTYSSAGASSYLDWSGDNTAIATYNSTLYQDTLNVESANEITVSNWVTFTDGDPDLQNTYIGSCMNGNLFFRQGYEGHDNTGDRLIFDLDLYDSSFNNFGVQHPNSNQWQPYSSYGLSSSDFGDWFNFTVTAASGSVRFYLNGTQQWSNNYDSSTYSIKRYKFAFGRMLTAADQSTPHSWSGFSGKWGNSAVYNRALSATEVSSNYDALKSRYGY